MKSDIRNGVLHVAGKPCPWFKLVDGEWQYVSDGPGKHFRTVSTFHEDGLLSTQWQHREAVDDQWVDIDNPWSDGQIARLRVSL